jgi:hypothetical protein
MAGFENYAEETREIELEIERKGIVLGIDWTDDVQVRALAKEALDQSAAEIKLAASSPIDRKLMAKVDSVRSCRHHAQDDGGMCWCGIRMPRRPSLEGVWQSPLD